MSQTALAGDQEMQQDDSQVSEKPTTKKSEAREYIVLEAVGQGTWKEVKRVVATSAEGAKRSLGEANLKDTSYVAVPTRNWNPEKPKIKTTTTISFE
jgi:hypothetical protein